jgi:exopolysaccharide production protein ExoZ
LVVLFHLNTAVFDRPKYFAGQPFGPIFDFGHSGVEFFFVLSGFIILYAHHGDIGDVSAMRRYLSRRFQRIYPIYWVVLAGLIPIYFAEPSFGFGYETDPITILSSIALVYTNGDTVLAPAWTLYHEVLFYAAFAALIWSRAIGIALFGAWAVGIAVFQAVSPEAPAVVHFLAAPQNLLFPLGILSAIVYRSAVRLPAAALATAGAVLFLGCGAMDVIHGRSGVGTLFYGLGSALLIVGTARLESAGRIRIPDALEFLGAASYSIYLTHFPVLSLFGKAAVAIGLRAAPEWLSFLLIGGATLALGCAFHAFVERPLLRWVRSFGARSRPPHPREAA